MHEDFYIELIYKNLKGDISANEKTQLDQWLAADKGNSMLQEEIVLSWQLADKGLDIDLDVEADLLSVKSKMNKGSKIKPSQKITKVRNLWPRRLAIAASFLFLATASFWVFNMQSNSPNIIVSQGEMKVIDLLDGSKVWLNKNSELSIAADFSKHNRNVSLTGEAFFKVEKNPNLPFIIKTQNSSVTVLGTSFNVKERKKKLTVAVESGKVRLSEEGGQSVDLIKGDIGIHLYESNTLAKNTLSSENANSWKDDRIKFSQQPLSQVIKELEFLYNTSITLDNTSIEDCEVSVLINSTSFPVVLDKICNTLDMKSEKTSSNSIRLLNGSCQ